MIEKGTLNSVLAQNFEKWFETVSRSFVLGQCLRWASRSYTASRSNTSLTAIVRQITNSLEFIELIVPLNHRRKMPVIQKRLSVKRHMDFSDQYRLWDSPHHWQWAQVLTRKTRRSCFLRGSDDRKERRWQRSRVAKSFLDSSGDGKYIWEMSLNITRHEKGLRGWTQQTKV